MGTEPQNLEDEMNWPKRWFCRRIAIGLVVLVSMPASESGLALAQQETQNQRPQNASAQQGSESTTVPGNALPDSPSPANSQARDQSGQASGSSQQQTSAQKPVGTAAAPYERTM